MITRTRSDTVTFRNAFVLSGVDRQLPPGSYRIDTDEELIEGLSFPAYRRVSTMLFLPALSLKSSVTEVIMIQPDDLTKALECDLEDRGAERVVAKIRRL